MGVRTAIIALALALTGCSTIAKLGNAQQNPVVAGTISVAAQNQCEQFAKDQPDQAKVTGLYLATLAAASSACVQGIQDGLVK
jgi:uncharacterized protein YceK